VNPLSITAQLGWPLGQSPKIISKRVIKRAIIIARQIPAAMPIIVQIKIITGSLAGGFDISFHYTVTKHHHWNIHRFVGIFINKSNGLSKNERYVTPAISMRNKDSKRRRAKTSPAH
jgi:hypothetical protein